MFSKMMMRSTSTKSVPTCPALFLIKLRIGISYSILLTLFGIQKRIIDKITGKITVRKALKSTGRFCPQSSWFESYHERRFHVITH